MAYGDANAFGSSKSTKSTKSTLNQDQFSVLRIHNPMDLSVQICNMFKTHEDALIKTFEMDLEMFEYMYEFLPKHISTSVLNNISIDDAVRIVRSNQSSTFVYGDINPILYVVRYFANKQIKDFMHKDAHCIEFKRSILPKSNIMSFVLECKKYLLDSEIKELIDIMTR